MKQTTWTITFAVLIALAGCRPKPTEGPAPDSHAQQLLDNALKYADPKHGLIDPASGYPVEGWNQDAQRGLFLRSFTQLTAIGEWVELLANVVAGHGEIPGMSDAQVREALAKAVTSLRKDQQDPGLSAKGLLVNFLALTPGGRQGPLAPTTKLKDFEDAFGPQRAAAIWKALTDAEWIAPFKNGLEANVTRSDTYGTEHFDGAMAPFANDATKHKIMTVLDERIVRVVFGDNANLSASVAKAIGALLHPKVKDDPELAKLRAEMERFIEAQREGYAHLYDERKGLFCFGWNANTGRLEGWETDQGKWIVGYTDYFVNEFRAPTMFAVVRHGFPLNAYANLGMKIKPYAMQDGRDVYALAPWEGSAFQAFGLSLFMGELESPAMRTLLENAADIELDFSTRHDLPGFLSEAYSGHDTEYTGDIGIPDITVAGKPRITDAPSLYTLGVAHQIRPDAVDAFLVAQWPRISSLFTDHGPWEGYKTSSRAPIEFQTAAHTLALILGLIGTGNENMARYLESKGLTDSLADLYRSGPPADLMSGEFNVFAWAAEADKLKSARDENGFSVKGSDVSGVNVAFVAPKAEGISLSGGTLRIRYRSAHDLTAAMTLGRPKDRQQPALPNEVFVRFHDTGDEAGTIEIPLPPTPGLREVKELVFALAGAGKKVALDLCFEEFAASARAHPSPGSLRSPTSPPRGEVGARQSPLPLGERSASAASRVRGEHALTRPERRPNIVVLFADDLGYGDVGYQGCTEVPTPHIDSIAENGVTFSCGYVTAPVCGPSRAGLMTGRYQNRFGFEDNPGPFRQREDVLVGTPLDQANMAERFKALGYVTGMIGKWHEGKDPRIEPHNRGFDEWFGFNNGASEYFVRENPKKMLVRNGKPVEAEHQYLTGAFGREAVAFIERHKASPFFLFVPFNAVHGPLQAIEEQKERFAKIENEKRRTTAAMLWSMDRNVGKILTALREQGLEENTLVFFLSDNGGKPGGNYSYNAPLRGEKGQLLEGGIRIPFCAQWKGRLPAGKRVDFPVISLDILPTALAAAGAAVPDGIDGIDLVPHVLGNKPTPERALYWRFLFQWAVRDAEWKLVKTKNDPEMLFHISEDMCEKSDLIGTHPEIAARLRKAHDTWATTLMKPQWGWQPAFCGKIRVEE